VILRERQPGVERVAVKPRERLDVTNLVTSRPSEGLEPHG